MTYNPKDYYFQKAKSQQYAARSIFKLEEMDQRFRLFRPGDSVLDLGAAPGSWSQYASKKVGKQGRILGIDLQPIRLSLPQTTFIVADLRDALLADILRENQLEPPLDVVLSDMAPKTTGVKITDQVRSMELCELALSIAIRFLKKNGNFVCKLFHSNDFEKLKETLRKNFQRVEVLRPKSTRKESKEIFLIGLHFKKMIIETDKLDSGDIESDMPQ